MPRKTDSSKLINKIGDLLTIARQHIAQTVTTILVKTYWEIGRNCKTRIRRESAEGVLAQSQNLKTQE
ncbi:MAG: hypothetical protein H8E71_07405 [Candidatus Marinimicrobia bacterium]|nr:hypothetical protein [Candidatus Neomarinimicrobiota bacterium]MBL7108969.1 hypothetical protein [Candidatus Neomarinimicrobiota bacterium]